MHMYFHIDVNYAAMDTHSNFTMMTAQIMQQGQMTNTRAIVSRDTQESCIII